MWCHELFFSLVLLARARVVTSQRFWFLGCQRCGEDGWMEGWGLVSGRTGKESVGVVDWRWKSELEESLDWVLSMYVNIAAIDHLGCLAWDMACCTVSLLGTGMGNFSQMFW